MNHHPNPTPGGTAPYQPLPPYQQLPPEHTGQAWYTNGFANEPALLRLAAGRLSLHVSEGLVFDERLVDIERIHVPWFWFSGGIVVTVRGRKEKVVFVRPDGAPDHDATALGLAADAGILAAGIGAVASGSQLWGDVAGVGRGARAALSIAPGRAAGKTWRALLGV